ncbi:hypothetical protein BCR35DRAFT_304933 [Leucosporidium creatinivorum]|uniref:C3H1-type domain-containing protein n=1 Tax=Leucosporidium creatinivorum TaxID=106004 RepID=A0A1Y2F4W8_9BASI|nr:hypothetical protein BCR35DRAFT_304933 [Leucosporidium creatinivorum]
MVAAPETQAAAAQAVNAAATSPAPATGKQLVNGATKTGDETEQQGAQGAGAHAASGGETGVNDLTVVDAPAASTSPADASDAAVNLPPRDIARNIPCRFFPLGTCKYGDQCVFSHGIAGVAGSPGVPSTAELHPAPAQEQQQILQHPEQFMHHPEGYPQGMPMYYPPMEHGGVEYGYQPAFSPQQGYYPFPPPFGHYQHQQHFQPGPMPPQAYYQPPPPPQAPQMIAEAPAPAASPSPVPSDAVQQPSPNSPEVQRALSPTTSTAPPFASPSAPQHLPLAPQGYPPYGAFPGQPEFGFAPQAAPNSPPTAFGPDGLPLPLQRQERAPSLHTFFQTGAPVPAGAQQQQAAPVAGAPGAFPKGAPRAPAAARRPGPPMAGLPFVGRGKPRYPVGTPKPPCSFFESNRCRNRDACPFQHLLPDGSDARHLGQNWAGVDGRTENLEERGGLPPAWLANPRYPKNAFKNAQQQLQQQQQNFNGGYSVREPRPRSRFEEEQHRLRMEAQQQAQVSQAQQQVGGAAPVEGAVEGDKPAVPLAHPLPAPPHARAQSEPRQPFNNGAMAGRLPPGGAPQLVAAINGLTRRIPPASAPAANGSAPSTAAPSTAAQQASQRIPSGADFPALSSPALEKGPSRPASPSNEATPAPPAAAESVSAPTPAAEEPSSSTTIPAASPAIAASETSESEFVMVNHSDAPAPPAPRIMGSFASAAARGASVVLPEKPKKVLIPPPVKAAPATAEGAETKESAPSTKEAPAKKDGKKGKGAKRAPASAAPAVKASA